MKTYTQARPFVDDPGYETRRRHYIDELQRCLSDGGIDAPIVPIVERMSRISCCFTLQSCYGHFVRAGGHSDYSVKRLASDIAPDSVVRYRIAYVAFCAQNNTSGRRLLEDLRAVADADPEHTQFGSAIWFWGRCVNSYVLQVQPARCVSEDSLDVGVTEAVKIEAARDAFYSRLDETIGRHL